MFSLRLKDRAKAVAAALLCATLSLWATGEARAEEVTKEYQVKAAFLYNFTKFVEWPAGSFPDPAAPLIVGVLGAAPFASELEQIVRDRKVNGHPIVVRNIQSSADTTTAHVLFVSAALDPQLADLQSALVGKPIVTAGESSAFASMGTITFVLQGDKVRFEINLAAAEQAGLRLSAQLLKLAITVRKGTQVTRTTN